MMVKYLRQVPEAVQRMWLRFCEDDHEFIQAKILKLAVKGKPALDPAALVTQILRADYSSQKSKHQAQKAKDEELELFYQEIKAKEEANDR